MTNEKLDRLMKNYVDRDTQAFEYREKKHRGLKAVSVIAAALVIAVGITLIPFPKSYGFTVVANAADMPQELSADSPIAVGEISRVSSGGMVDDGSVMYVTEQASADITVKGENIKKITYRVNQGKIIASRKINDIIVNVSGTGGTETYYNESFENDGGYLFYDTLTMDYEANPDFALSGKDYLTFVIGGDANNYNKDILDRYWKNIQRDKTGFATDPDLPELNEMRDIIQAYYEEVFRGVELDVTVEYTDSKTETQTVQFRPEWKLETQPQKLLMYTYDEATRTAAITHDVREADGIVSDAWHTFKYGVNTFTHSIDDENSVMIKLDVSEDDITPGYFYSIDGTLCGTLK